MLGVSGSYPRFTLRGPRSGGVAAGHAASVPACNNGVLARSAFSRFRMAPLARPVRAEPRATARFNQRFSIIWM